MLLLLTVFLILINYSKSCLTEKCNSKCLSGNNANKNTKLSNNYDSVLRPNINEETDEDTSSIFKQA